MAYPKKPKLKKAPKQPKDKASVDVWKGYEAKAKAVASENKKKMDEWKKKCDAIDKIKADKEKFKKSAHKALGKI